MTNGNGDKAPEIGGPLWHSTAEALRPKVEELFGLVRLSPKDKTSETLADVLEIDRGGERWESVWPILGYALAIFQDRREDEAHAKEILKAAREAERALEFLRECYGGWGAPGERDIEAGLKATHRAKEDSTFFDLSFGKQNPYFHGFAALVAILSIHAFREPENSRGVFMKTARIVNANFLENRAWGLLKELSNNSEMSRADNRKGMLSTCTSLAQSFITDGEFVQARVLRRSIRLSPLERAFAARFVAFYRC